MLSTDVAPLFDDLFNLTHTTALKYQRSVEMFQWEETEKSHTKKSSSGGTTTTTTYSYSTDWSRTLINTNNFQKPQGHENPTRFLMDPSIVEVGASHVKLGAYSIGSQIYERISWWETWKNPPVNVDNLDLGPLPTTVIHRELEEPNNSANSTFTDDLLTVSPTVSTGLATAAPTVSTGAAATAAPAASNGVGVTAAPTVSSGASITAAPTPLNGVVITAAPTASTGVAITAALSASKEDTVTAVPTALDGDAATAAPTDSALSAASSTASSSPATTQPNNNIAATTAPTSSPSLRASPAPSPRPTLAPTRDPSKGVIYLQGNYVHVVKKKGASNVADTRIHFSIVLPDEASAIAYQDSIGRLGPYRTEGGRELLLFERGIRSGQQMFAKAEAENNMISWLLRFTGFFLMFLSIYLILLPLAVFVDVIPLCGDFLESCLGGCAVMISFPLSLLTISIAWIFYRPAFAAITVALLIVSCFLIYKVKQQVQAKSKEGRVDEQTRRYSNINSEMRRREQEEEEKLIES